MGNVTLITTRGGVEIPTRIVNLRPWKNKQGQDIRDPKSIRRALAYGYAGYVGPMVCRCCNGTLEVMPVQYVYDTTVGHKVARFDEPEDCKMCIQGIPKNVCGDCQTPLPACECLQKDHFFIQAESGPR